MDLDLKKAVLENPEWMYERRRMKTMKSLLAVFGPAVMIMFLFFVNVIHLEPKTLREPAISKKMQDILDDDSNPRYWYSTLAPKKRTMVAKK
jgi:hypothetical protein